MVGTRFKEIWRLGESNHDWLSDCGSFLSPHQKEHNRCDEYPCIEKQFDSQPHVEGQHVFCENVPGNLLNKFVLENSNNDNQFHCRCDNVEDLNFAIVLFFAI